MERTTKLRGHCSPKHTLFHWCTAMLFVASFLGCGGFAGSGPSQPPPSDVAVTVAPMSASVLLGNTQSFTAAVAHSTNTAVVWSVNGIQGGSPIVGTIDSSGDYTAPGILPAPASVSVQATSVADSSKKSGSLVTVASDITISVAPQTMQVALGATQPFAATVNSAGHPNRGVTWAISGNGCPGAACGIVDASGTYTAPEILSAPPSFSMTATSVADPSKSSSGTITIASLFTLAVTGPSSVNAGASATFTATLTPAANSNPSRVILWSVAGAGCTGAACGAISSAGVYTAPLIAPSPAAVRIIATPAADPAKATSLAVTILPVFGVSISPSTVVLPLGSSQIFQATVTGLQNATIAWDVNGIAGGNATVGTLLTSPSSPFTTTYTAPQTLPPNSSVVVRAISNAPSNMIGSATVTFTNATVLGNPSLLSLSPTSAYAGSAGGFTLQVSGLNFASSLPGPGSVLLISGSPRTAVCASTIQCTATLTAADLQIAGNFSVGVENPAGTLSNSLSFVVLSPGPGPKTISLSPSAPASAGNNFAVVDLSSNGASGGASLNIAAIGAYSVATGSCVLAGSPVILLRPATGTATSDLCVFSSSGLAPSFVYTISGPATPDITVLARQALQLGILHLTLQVPSTAAPGPRTLFVQNPEGDQAAATGVLEVR